MQKREQVFIGGKWHNAGDNTTIDVLNPATGAAIGTVPRCGRAETADAIDVANEAFESWRFAGLMHGPMCSTACTRH